MNKIYIFLYSNFFFKYERGLEPLNFGQNSDFVSIYVKIQLKESLILKWQKDHLTVSIKVFPQPS